MDNEWSVSERVAGVELDVFGCIVSIARCEEVQISCERYALVRSHGLRPEPGKIRQWVL
jgi:hypothetical protein